MNEAAFRDVERSSQRSSEISSDGGYAAAGGGANFGPWRDKIEVRLDNRQVFFLFFGSALCACMLFVLGVIVGKRLESRGRAAIPEVQDPLAVLDRVTTPGSAAASASVPAEPALTFPKALIGSPAKAHSAPLAPKASPAAAPRMVAPVAPKAAPAIAPKAPPPVTPKATPTKATAVASARPAARSPSASVSIPPASITAVAPPAPAVAPAAAPAKGKFTLVLSSFPDRGEADAFAKRFAAQGAYVAVADSPGKHGIYSVRVGNYASSQEAATAKTAFERQTKTIAYVAGR